MILIAGSPASVDTTGWPPLSRDLYERKRKSPYVFNYSSLDHLRFEMLLRAAIVQAAIDLDRSGVEFATFEFARCNDRYWRLTPRGGFQLKEGVRPSDAIRDIYLSGPMYAFECATAIPIVYYKAVLDVLGEEQFNRLFQNLLLYSWNFDSDLGLIQERVNPEKAVPGDVLYFNNPDFHPRAPEWQGVNVVMIDDDLYFGHGIGITTGEDIIRGLNMRRRLFSFRSAYLMDLIVYPDFAYLSRFMPRPTAGAAGSAAADLSGATAVQTGASVAYAVSGSSPPGITPREPGEVTPSSSAESSDPQAGAIQQSVEGAHASADASSSHTGDALEQTGEDAQTAAAGSGDSAEDALHRPDGNTSPAANPTQSSEETGLAPWLILPPDDLHCGLPRIRARVGRRRYIL